jgi:hypothetical protein
MNDFTGMYDIRLATDKDNNFILATFLRGLYYGDSWFSQIPKEIFMANYKAVGEALLSPNKTTIKIACLKEDPSVILGYSILSKDETTIIWLYVKSVWRNKGIAKSLVPKELKAVTHLTKLGQTLLSKYPGAIFNPFWTP